jgi:hypothetical protein
MPGKEVALMRRIIVLSTLAAAMAFMLALAGSASAAKSETKIIHDEGTDVLANCGGFKVLDDWVLDARQTTFFDSAGNPDYDRWHFEFHDFFYNSKTGEGFAEINTVNVVFDLQSSATEGSGLNYHVTVPGEGVVLLDVGRLEHDEAGEVAFVAGPHQVHLGEDTDKLCAALA